MNEILGCEGSRFYVNSAAALSRDRVEKLFPSDARPDDSIPLALVERELGADAILGRVAIREAFRKQYVAATDQRTLSTERARQLLRGKVFPKWHEIEWTTLTSLTALVAQKVEARAAGIAERTGEPFPVRWKTRP